MKDYEVIEWPEIQELMDLDGFEQHSTLIYTNEYMGIGSSTYLVEVEWLRKMGIKE